MTAHSMTEGDREPRRFSGLYNDRHALGALAAAVAVLTVLGVPNIIKNARIQEQHQQALAEFHKAGVEVGSSVGEYKLVTRWKDPEGRSCIGYQRGQQWPQWLQLDCK